MNGPVIAGKLREAADLLDAGTNLNRAAMLEASSLDLIETLQAGSARQSTVVSGDGNVVVHKLPAPYTPRHTVILRTLIVAVVAATFGALPMPPLTPIR